MSGLGPHQTPAALLPLTRQLPKPVVLSIFLPGPSHPLPLRSRFLRPRALLLCCHLDAHNPKARLHPENEPPDKILHSPSQLCQHSRVGRRLMQSPLTFAMPVQLKSDKVLFAKPRPSVPEKEEVVVAAGVAVSYTHLTLPTKA